MLAILIPFTLFFTASAATPPNTTITNTVLAKYTLLGTSIELESSAAIITEPRTPSLISFLHIIPAGNPILIPASSFDKNRTDQVDFEPITAMDFDGTTYNFSGMYPVEETSQFLANEPVIIQVIDRDQNLDAAVTETVIVVLINKDTGDEEHILLTESAPDSGIFRGAMGTTQSVSIPFDGKIGIRNDSKITVRYYDKSDNKDISITAAQIDRSASIQLSKKADLNIASVGDTIKYTLTVSSDGLSQALQQLRIDDTLPPGFRYIDNTALLNSEPLEKNKITLNGRSIRFDLGTMPASSTWVLSYRTRVSAGTPIGEAVNRARAISTNGRSTIARAIVTLKDELMRKTSLLTGRVRLGCGEDSQVVPHVRILLETGRVTTTDKSGFWHMEGVKPGTHIVSLDEDSLPEGLEPLLCHNTTQRGGKATSQFVDLKAGTLWRADFYLSGNLKTVSNTDDMNSAPSENENENADPEDSEHRAEKKESPKTGVTIPDKKMNPLEKFGNDFVRTATPGFKILWPPEKYVPEIASTAIAIQHPSKYQVEVTLNNKPVNPLNFDGSSKNKTKGITVSRWKGVDIDVINRENRLRVTLKDTSGKVLDKKTTLIHFSGTPTYVEFLPELSSLIADGVTEPVIAVRVKDQEQFPMRASTYGYFSIAAGNYAVKDTYNQAVTLNREAVKGEHKYYIEEGGIAKIKLKPTTSSGEIVLNFLSGGQKNKIVKAWLKPYIRDKWVLVGLAEGTIGYNKIKGNLQTLRELKKDSDLYTNGRIAFFAKGRVKGEYLLTLAYDSAKEATEIGSQLGGNIDPNAWYTVYGDRSTSSYQAPSSRKLYVKLEKKQFYALFGDYRSNMTVTELSRYERTLNGIHSEYKGRNYRYNISLSDTKQQHQREEIPGDGTSGEYSLSYPPIVNSEVITLETRDRFHPERILSQRLLAQNADYEIDYDSPSLFFKFPISSRDSQLNPIYIVVDYETNSSNKKSLTMSGRAAYLTNDGKFEAGVSLIHEAKNGTNGGDLLGVDIHYKPDDETTLKVEIAQSKTQSTGQAFLLEARKENSTLQGRAYIRQQDTTFGLGQQNLSEKGTRKAGVEARYRLGDDLSLNADIYRQQNLDNDQRLDQASLELQKRFKNGEIHTGLRHTQELLKNTLTSAQSNTRSGNLVTLGGSITPNNGRVSLRAHVEKNLSKNNETKAYPDRLIVGTDVRLTEGVSAFLEHETTRSTKSDSNTNRIGLNTKLWEGASAKSTLNHEQSLDVERVFGTLGLAQQLQINDHLKANLSIDHTKTVSESGYESIDTAAPPVSGALRDDYTAFSVGLGWNDEKLSWTSRLEHRLGDRQDKSNIRFGILRQLGEGKDVTGHLQITRSVLNTGEKSHSALLSLGSAWHPINNDYTILQRLDLKYETKENVGDVKRSRKIIHNIHVNKRAGKKTQISLHHGVKHTLEDEFNQKFSSIIDTTQVQIRRNISQKVDIGVHAGYLHDWETGNWEYNLGGSVGATPAENMWLSVGYNLEGFSDVDFDESEYTSQGAYLQLRYRADKDQLSKLVKHRGIVE